MKFKFKLNKLKRRYNSLGLFPYWFQLNIMYDQNECIKILFPFENKNMIKPAKQTITNNMKNKPKKNPHKNDVFVSLFFYKEKNNKLSI